MKGERIDWVDNLKGIGIMLVVWGHFYPPILIKKWIYSFHMPLFFFLSGYLRKQRSFKDTIAIKTKTLLIPYIVIALISFPIGFIRDYAFSIQTSLGERIGQLFFIDGSVGWNSPIWFLLVLYLVEIAYSFIDSIKVNKNLILIISFFAGYVIYMMGIVLPLGIHIVLWMLPFYHIGFLFRKSDIINRVRKKQSVFFGLLFVLANIIITTFTSKEVPEIYHSILNNYFLYYINAVIMIIGLCLLFKYFRKINILETFSRNALFILETHYFMYYGFLVIDRFVAGNRLFLYSFIPSIFMTSFVLLAYYIYFKYLDIIKTRISAVKTNISEKLF